MWSPLTFSQLPLHIAAGIAVKLSYILVIFHSNFILSSCFLGPPLTQVFHCEQLNNFIIILQFCTHKYRSLYNYSSKMEQVPPKFCSQSRLGLMGFYGSWKWEMSTIFFVPFPQEKFKPGENTVKNITFFITLKTKDGAIMK